MDAAAVFRYALAAICVALCIGLAGGAAATASRRGRRLTAAKSTSSRRAATAADSANAKAGGLEGAVPISPVSALLRALCILFRPKPPPPTNPFGFTDDPYDYEPIGEPVADHAHVVFARHRGNGLSCVMKNSNSIDNHYHGKRETLAAQTLNDPLAPSPFVVRLLHSFSAYFDMYLILECIKGDEMEKLAAEHRLDKTKIREYAAQMVLGLKYIVERGVLYNDMKLSNMVLSTNGRVVFLDFGACRNNYKKGDKQFVHNGALDYASPEKLDTVYQVFLGRGYTHVSDFYSFGVCIYNMYCDRILVSRWVLRIRQVERPPCEALKADKDALDLVERLLEPDPDKRLGAVGDFEEIMAHPYFAQKGPNYFRDLEQHYRKVQLDETPVPGVSCKPNETTPATDTKPAAEKAVAASADAKTTINGAHAPRRASTRRTRRTSTRTAKKLR